MSSLIKTVTMSDYLSSKAYLLIYSLPLLFISLVLTFAGAFLTLDRTRSFSPSYDSVPGGLDDSVKKGSKSRWFVLEGGVGGLFAGYAFGLHCSTFLALLIPTMSSSAALTNPSFLAVWLLVSITTTLLAGRWKYVALLLSGITGGATLSLGISVMIHPSLLVRLISMGILLPAVTIAVLLPIERTQHPSLRLALSSTGAFGVVVSISLLADVPAWADVWSRLWLNASAEWGTSAEKGLTVAYCFLFTGGGVCDWVLRYRIGENPDERWDSYLANYTSHLPHLRGRAGAFRPLTNWWSRLFGQHDKNTILPIADTKEIIFPSDVELKIPPSDIPLKMHDIGNSPVSLSPTPPTARAPELLRKPTRRRTQTKGFGFRSRKAIKFAPDGYGGSSESESELDTPKTPGPTGVADNVRLWSPKRPPPSSYGSRTTLVHGADAEVADGFDIDIEKEKARIYAEVRKNSVEIPDYSDHEEDLTTLANPQQHLMSRDTPGWTPPFLQRHNSSSAHTSSSHRTAASMPPAGALPVPATPSLIRAVERINAAQEEAFRTVRPGLPSQKSSEPGLIEGLPRPQRSQEHQGPQWDQFWRDVIAKAGTTS